LISLQGPQSQQSFHEAIILYFFISLIQIARFFFSEFSLFRLGLKYFEIFNHYFFYLYCLLENFKRWRKKIHQKKKRERLTSNPPLNRTKSMDPTFFSPFRYGTKNKQTAMELRNKEDKTT
jgi:hypothetical protein